MQKTRWGEKRYHSVDYEWKNQFGEKVYKVALDGGMTCPTRDGTLGTHGCIFCSAMGSGEFASPQCCGVTAQIDHGIQGLKQSKHVGEKFIAYFQSFTNTYAPVSHLRPMFMEAITHPQIVALSIATRPDCLPADVLALLYELNQIKPIIVELGLQTINEKTAAFIQRGYELSVFDHAIYSLQQNRIQTIAHIILGLPGDTKEDMLSTALHCAAIGVDGLKLQSLHLLKGTTLEQYQDRLSFPTLGEYADLVINILTKLPPDIIIHRITGDPPSSLLIAPQWSTHKREVMNTINSRLAKKDLWQGCAESR